MTYKWFQCYGFGKFLKNTKSKVLQNKTAQKELLLFFSRQFVTSSL